MYNKKNRNKKLNVNVNNKYLHQKVELLQSQLELERSQNKMTDSLREDAYNAQKSLYEDTIKHYKKKNNRNEVMKKEMSFLALALLLGNFVTSFILFAFNIKGPLSSAEMLPFATYSVFLIPASALCQTVLSGKFKSIIKWTFRIMMLFLPYLYYFHSILALIIITLATTILVISGMIETSKYHKKLKQLTKEFEDKHKND